MISLAADFVSQCWHSPSLGLWVSTSYGQKSLQGETPTKRVSWGSKNRGENSAFNNDFQFLDLSCSPHASDMGELCLLLFHLRIVSLFDLHSKRMLLFSQDFCWSFPTSYVKSVEQERILYINLSLTLFLHSPASPQKSTRCIHYRCLLWFYSTWGKNTSLLL